MDIMLITWIRITSDRSQEYNFNSGAFRSAPKSSFDPEIIYVVHQLIFSVIHGISRNYIYLQLIYQFIEHKSTSS